MDGWIDRQMDVAGRWMDGQRGKWMNGWLVGYTNGWTDGHMDGAAGEMDG